MGFTASPLTRGLLAVAVRRGEMGRWAERRRARANGGAEVVPGNIQVEALPRQYAEGCDVVFHVAAVGVGSTTVQYATNVQGTRNVIRAAHAAGAQRFVPVTSIAAYGYEVHGQINEAYIHHPPRLDPHMRTKA